MSDDEQPAPVVELLRLVPYEAAVLHTPAAEVQFPLSAEDSALIASMLFSVTEDQLKRAHAPWPSAAGMAAPQWGRAKRIFVWRAQYLAQGQQMAAEDAARPKGLTTGTTQQEAKSDEADGKEQPAVLVGGVPVASSRTHAAATASSDDAAATGGASDGPDAVAGVGFAAAINPKYVAAEGAEDEEAWEGCFSVPGVRGRVRRHSRIVASFSTPDGTRHKVALAGFPARVFQHECDHCHGRLYDNTAAGRCTEKLDASLFP